MISLEAGYDMGVSEFVKTRGNRLVGPFRVLQTLVWKKQKASFAALLSYTSFVAGDLTAAQRAKFLDAVEHPRPSMADPKNYWDDDVIDVSIPSILPHPGRIEDLSGSPRRYMPTNDGRSIVEDQNLLEQSLFWFQNTAVWDIAHPYKHGSRLSSYLGGLTRYSLMHTLKTGEPLVSFAGRVSCIQEPGYKARFICNPSRFWQLALKPLGDALFGILQDLPWDCTFDQDRAIPGIQDFLAKGKTVYCFDLSNATDVFPLDIQLSLVRKMVKRVPQKPGPHGIFKPEATDLISLFACLARADYWMQSEQRFVRWSKGQPLGLYPSFAMFALTHGFMLKQLAQRCGAFTRVLEKGHQPFYVLGDDVIILDDALSELYKRELDLLGVEISEPKSLTSNVMAEFTGRIITKDLVHVPVKWRNISPDNWIDFLRQTGPNGIDLLPRHIRHVAKAVSSLPEPLGFGWNPEGVSVVERLGDLLEVYLRAGLDTPLPWGKDTSLKEDIIFRSRRRVIVRDLPDFRAKTQLPSLRQENLNSALRLLIGLNESIGLPVNDLHFWMVDQHFRGTLSGEDLATAHKSLGRYLNLKPAVPEKHITVLDRVKTLLSMR